MTEQARINEHYGRGGIMERIRAGLAAAGRDITRLAVDDLAPIDSFHTRGRDATREVADLANLQSSDEVLDVGCGLGGTARHLADVHGCRITGIDLTEEFVAVGRELNELVGLADLVTLQCASALDIPCDDNTFDVVWTEHVQMNIADKQQFYGEIARVLRPGGRFVFHDVFLGPAEEPVYPTPWAEDQSLDALASASAARSMMEQASLQLTRWMEKVEESIAFFELVSERIETDGPPPIGIHLLMGDNAREKIQNYARNLSEDRVLVAMGLATKKAKQN